MDEPTIVVGVVTKAHGLRGEVAVQSRSDNPERFVPGASMQLPDGTILSVASVHEHGKVLLVGFDQVPDRTAAEALRGSELRVPQSWLPDLADGEYWPHQLEGCRVITEAGLELGRLSEVIPNPANDLWVVRDEEGGEALVPAVGGVIVDVDLDERRVLVRDIPGLTAPDDEA